MGYEVKYNFHEKIDGEYNKEEVKTFKKKVGDPFDDTPLEKLAGAIMAQFARRDILITDVEIFELSKKQVSFKESKGGITIKNRKFLFDGGSIIVEDAVVQSEEQPVIYPHEQHVNIQRTEHPHNNGQRKPVDWMIFFPEPQHLFEAKQKNLRLTPDKKYAILSKKPAQTGIGDILTLIDDAGREQSVSDKYFVPANIKLLADAELGFSENVNKKEGKLLYGDVYSDDNMPDLRR